MGNCFTSCLPACGNSGALRNFNMLSSSRNDFTFLVEERSQEPTKRSFLSRIFKRHKERQKKHQPMGMVEGLLNPQLAYNRLPESQVSPQSLYTSRDIQLHYLDAKALLGRTNTSTPENSLDLEWEHETLPISSMIHEPSGSSWETSILPEDTLTTLPNESPVPNGVGPHVTESDWSRVSSSANSLEWDSVQNSIHSECDTIDTDTQFLLNEIDRLTMQALNETGVVSDGMSYLDDTL